MKQKCVFSGLVLGTLLIAYEGNSWADGEYHEPNDLRASNQAPKQATPSLFSNLLEMILAIRQSEPVPVEPQYRLVFPSVLAVKLLNRPLVSNAYRNAKSN